MERLSTPPKLKWNLCKKWKANYVYGIIQLQEYDDDLYIKFTSSFKGVGNLFYVIREYKHTNPASILASNDDMTQGRHFNDAILDFYHSKHLNLGYARL